MFKGFEKSDGSITRKALEAKRVLAHVEQPSSNLADEALSESGENQDRALDREPTSANATHPREAYKKLGIVHVDNFPASQPVTIPTPLPISATSLPLPLGASTSAKQPSIGIAGVASPDIITIQGTDAGNGNPIPVAGAGGGLVSVGVATANTTGYADGVTNGASPVISVTGGTAAKFPVYGHVFNGTTWDRLRGNQNIATGDTGAKVATFNGATQTNFNARGAIITILLGVVSGTTPTLSAQLQWSPDGGTTWINLGAPLPNLTASNQQGVFVVSPALLTGLTTGATQTSLISAPLPRTWRIVYTISGTTPSFAISSVQVNYTN